MNKDILKDIANEAIKQSMARNKQVKVSRPITVVVDKEGSTFRNENGEIFVTTPAMQFHVRRIIIITACVTTNIIVAIVIITIAIITMIIIIITITHTQTQTHTHTRTHARARAHTHRSTDVLLTPHTPFDLPHSIFTARSASSWERSRGGARSRQR
jgi:hypothetical protein